MRREGMAAYGLGDCCGHLGRQDVPRAAGGVFGLVVVEIEVAGRDDVNDIGRGVVDDAAGQLASRDVALDHDQAFACGGDLSDGFRRAVGAAPDDDDTDARAFRDRLGDVGRLERMRRGCLVTRNQHAGGDRHAVPRDDLLGRFLVHGEGGGQHARVGVGEPHHFQEALDAAVLTPAAVQGVEADIGLQLGERRGQIAIDVDARDAKALALQRVGAFPAGRQRHLALGRPAAHEDSDVLRRHCAASRASEGPVSWPGIGSPMRMISQSSVTP